MPNTFSKDALRRTFLDKRFAESPADQEMASRAVASSFFRNVSLKPHGVIAGYWPIRRELDDRFILFQLASLTATEGYICALPRTGVSLLSFHIWEPQMTMSPGKHGISEPNGPEVIPDVVLVPMVAFDKDKHRLGYGGGYYDRTLAHLRHKKSGLLAIGLAYDWQLHAGLPAEENDVKMDMIITDKKVYT